LESQVFDSPLNCNACPVEVQPAIFETIRLATASGIIVIEPAGNGNLYSKRGNNLDRVEVNKKQILNPDNLDFRDSGAIIVGAASATTPHMKIGSSNYGNRINCYAWGEKVTTAGSFPNSSGSAKNIYTGKFNGTSAASAIIAGTTISVQSIAEANFGCRLSPIQMRSMLSDDLYGTSSVNGRFKDKIGVMPDLKKIIDRVFVSQKNAKYANALSKQKLIN
jgi:hypothetical protein